MIPKIIHYCWFGGNEFSPKVKKCIDSWKRFCPDYQIIQWNEKNFDINCMDFTKGAYEAKKYAFVSDVARLVGVNQIGGIYMDTDVEVIKSLDPLLSDQAFIGFENNHFVNTGQIIASEKDNPLITQMIKRYQKEDFFNADGTMNLLGCPIVNTEILEKNGLIKNGEKQTVKGMVVYPADYFNPLDSSTDELKLTENTYSIHWYSQSWVSRKDRIRSKIVRRLHRVFGVDFFKRFKRNR